MVCSLLSVTMLHLGLLPLLFFLLSLSDLTNANKQCKSTVMNVIMKQCSGARARRDIEESVERKQDAAPAKILQFDHLVKNQDPTDFSAYYNWGGDLLLTKVPRNYASENVGVDAQRSNQRVLPIPRDWIHSITKYRGGLSPRMYYSEGASGHLPHDVVGDLEMDLSNEEVEELYSEINQRLPRAARSKEEARKLFMATAAKCCQNVELCMKHVRLIPCI